MEPPGAPKKAPPTKKQMANMAISRENMNNLRRKGGNLKNMLEPNEIVEVFKFSPIEEHMARTHVERSAANIRAGMVTPTKQIQNTSALGIPRNPPGAPLKKRKSNSRRNQSKSRRDRRRSRKN
jgi:hypothetical protein